MERAANDGYYRIEICIPEQDAVRLLEEALMRVYNARKIKHSVSFGESKEAVMIHDFM